MLEYISIFIYLFLRYFKIEKKKTNESYQLIITRMKTTRSLKKDKYTEWKVVFFSLSGKQEQQYAISKLYRNNYNGKHCHYAVFISSETALCIRLVDIAN